MDKAARIIVACCWLHSYCELLNQSKPLLANASLRGDPLVGFESVSLPMARNGEASKCEGERLRKKLFRQWVLGNPNDK